MPAGQPPALQIEILGTETLGVRGLCCFVRTPERRILIDPGVALGYRRYGLLPHPLQVAVDERVQEQILARWGSATDILISHFHGDHVPLRDANPYQLHLDDVVGSNPDVRVWVKPPDACSPLETQRASDLGSALAAELRAGSGRQEVMTFSPPVPHGESDREETVMMTRIEAGEVFVHASDIQLLNDEAVSQILDWEPDIALVGGPPLYLDRLAEEQVQRAWKNALRLARGVDRLVLDHHLMRDREGLAWLDRLSGETGRPVMCAADFMGMPRRLLEADRQQLYEDMSVAPDWHQAYAEGGVDTDPYWRRARGLYPELGLGPLR